MSGSIAIEDRHLDVHKYYVRFGMYIGFRFEEIVQSFFAIPYRIDREAKLLDGLQSDLLIDLAVQSC